MRTKFRLVALAGAALLVGGVAASQMKAQSSVRPKPLHRSIERSGSRGSQSTFVKAEVAVPGSPEATRIEAHSALVKQGLAPEYWVKCYPAKELPAAVIPDDVGTHINPDPDVKGQGLELQKEFAAVLSRFDPRPASRQDHFAWMANNEYVLQNNICQIGWYGGVLDARRLPDGGWLVRVEIRPRLYSPFVKTAQPDCVVETYRYSGGQLQLVDSDAAIPKPELQIFPIR